MESDLGDARTRTLGRTGLQVGRFGISSSYGADEATFEEAFERGCTYFTWGTFIKGRSRPFRKAFRSLVSHGHRADLVLGLLTYAHWAPLTEWGVRRGLKALGTDYVDVLLLGYYAKVPPPKVLEGARKLQRLGMVRFLGLTSHHRYVFRDMDEVGGIDVVHVRYNAAHSGAEADVFPHLAGDDRPGVVSFTATDWNRLRSAKRMPPGEAPLSAADCYRFVLAHPAVDVCMTGIKGAGQLRENLAVLDAPPPTDEEMARWRRIGDHVYGKPRRTPDA